MWKTCRTLTFFKDASKNTVSFGSDVDDEDMVIGCMCMCDADTKKSCAENVHGSRSFLQKIAHIQIQSCFYFLSNVCNRYKIVKKILHPVKILQYYQTHQQFFFLIEAVHLPIKLIPVEVLL
jgi:hypothetical protein